MSLSNNILIGYTKDKTYFINLEKEIEKRIDYDNFSSEIDGKIMVLKNGKINLEMKYLKVFQTKSIIQIYLF